MTTKQPQQQYAIGMVGLGVMRAPTTAVRWQVITRTRPKSRPCARNQRNVVRFASVHLGDSSFRISRSAWSQS